MSIFGKIFPDLMHLFDIFLYNNFYWWPISSSSQDKMASLNFNLTKNCHKYFDQKIIRASFSWWALSVVIVVNFSHFHPLLQNHFQTNLAQSICVWRLFKWKTTRLFNMGNNNQIVKNNNKLWKSSSPAPLDQFQPIVVKPRPKCTILSHIWK